MLTCVMKTGCFGLYDYGCKVLYLRIKHSNYAIMSSSFGAFPSISIRCTVTCPPTYVAWLMSSIIVLFVCQLLSNTENKAWCSIHISLPFYLIFEIVMFLILHNLLPCQSSLHCSLAAIRNFPLHHYIWVS